MRPFFHEPKASENDGCDKWFITHWPSSLLDQSYIDMAIYLACGIALLLSEPTVTIMVDRLATHVCTNNTRRISCNIRRVLNGKIIQWEYEVSNNNNYYFYNACKLVLYVNDYDAIHVYM